MTIHKNADQWYFTYNTTSVPFTFSVGDLSGSEMKTEIHELAAGFVGVVLQSIDGSYVPIADTRACKSRKAAERRARKLALDIVKNGYSG